MATLPGDTVFSGLSLSGLGQLSFRTLASAASLNTGQFGVVQQASGLSLMFRSADTAYTVGASAVSVAL